MIRKSTKIVWCLLALGPVAVLAALLLPGCATPDKSDSTWPDITRRRTNYPESALASLPSETIAEIERFSASVVEPDTVSFRKTAESRREYLAWYRKGYAFAFITGAGHLRDQVSRHDQPEVEQAKVLGWFDGNSSGRLARRLKDIDAAVGKGAANHTK
jgi:hypothetical protein